MPFEKAEATTSWKTRPTGTRALPVPVPSAVTPHRPAPEPRRSSKSNLATRAARPPRASSLS